MGSINFKKRSLNVLIPFQIGINVYLDNLYIFKSATNNSLGTVFNPSLFNSPYYDIINITPPNEGQQTFYFDGSTWVYSFGIITNANNYVIPNNSIIQMQTDNVTSVPVGGGAFIQKYYFGNGNFKSRYLSTLPTSRVSSGPIQGSYIYQQQRTLTNGIDIYPTGDNGRETYQIKYQGPVNTRLIDILDPFLIFTADPDAQNYFNNANITDRIAKINISEFCLGLKNLNVWDKLEKIWILKSGYNYDGRNGFGPEDYKNFYDLKNLNSSGSGFGGIIKSLSGYKIQTNSLAPVSSRLYFPNYPIKFTGNWTTMFLLENYTGSLPTTYQAFLSNDDYQKSGFRMGYGAGSKEFNFWNSESVPAGGFSLTETNSHPNKYSFITANLSTGTLGNINSGAAKLLVDNKNIIKGSGSYQIADYAITNLSNPAGGNYGFENNIAFFALSYQDISNYHSGIRDLAKNTICNNLNF
jgi:hypothetical protein